jgi:ribonuclease D
VKGWIRTPEELGALARSLEGCRAIALDSESDSLYHHFEKVCLVQLATDRGDACLVDPLALRDLSPLAPFMAEPGVTKVLHGADYDVTTLKRDFGFSFAGLFDTMIAARFLGLPEIGLQALAKAELGVTLSKDSQKDDWSRRPLTPTQEAYALADVQHLLPLHDRLEARLVEKGRLEWAREEWDAVAALEPARRKKDGEAWQRIKGARRLKPRALGALRELVAWREGRAEATDTPAFKILGNEALMALAEKLPGKAEELGAVRGIPSRLRERPGELIEVLRRARELPDRDLPSFAPAPRPPAVADVVRQRAEALKAWRTRAAKELALDVSVVLPQRLIDRLAESAPRRIEDLSRVDGLRRWRIRALGREILGALDHIS